MLDLRSAAIEAAFDGDVTQTGTLGLKSHSNAHVVPHRAHRVYGPWPGVAC
jgi:hypothetical protein